MSERTERAAPPESLAGDSSGALRAGEGGSGGAREAHPSPGGEAPPPSPARGEGKNPRKRRLALVALVLAAVAVAGYFALRTTEPRNDGERFQGDWQIAVAGRNTPNAVTVTGDRWENLGGKAYRLTLNEAADPREIDLELIDAPKMTGPAVKLHGVYAFEGNNTVRMRVAPGTQPRPKSLDAADVPEWVLTRVKLQEAPGPGR
ncbi:unnamed protein product [Gemmataceae bacterium]|nr:unnamed protein product [Gemmataceae bacterium]VTT97680.1 unnamed protein product [Gemmataceae bacterium]